MGIDNKHHLVSHPREIGEVAADLHSACCYMGSQGLLAYSPKGYRWTQKNLRYCQVAVNY